MTAQLPPIYVISLARETARREDIKQRLTALGANYEIVDAVDGKTIAPKEYMHRLRPLHSKIAYNGELTKGEIGCFLSHYNLWQKIANQTDDCALILEDDAVWDNDFAEVIAKVANCEWHWEIVLFSAGKSRPADYVLSDFGNGRKLVRYKRRPATTAAYLLRPSGAKKLLSHCQNIRASVDTMYTEFWKHGAAFYHLDPAPARQSGAQSQMEYETKHSPLIWQITASLRRKYERTISAIYRKQNPPQKK